MSAKDDVPAANGPWLPARVRSAGGIARWNAMDSERSALLRTLDAMCQATCPEQAFVEVSSRARAQKQESAGV